MQRNYISDLCWLRVEKTTITYLGSDMDSSSGLSQSDVHDPKHHILSAAAETFAVVESTRVASA